MNLRWVWVGALALANLGLMLPGPRAVTQAVSRPACRVGVVFDVGGRGDKSFNDAAYAGLTRAQQRLPIETRYLEPSEGADREAALRLLASQGYQLVVGVGFIFSDDLRAAAADYPQTHFAGIDYVPPQDAQGQELQPPANLTGLRFREAEGSYLAGALAALMSKSGRVGFIGGMKIPLIQRFESGFVAGAQAIQPDVQVVRHYAGVNSAAFNDPAKGKELASSQYASGVDVIYHAAGPTGMGVFEAARQFQRFAIGVDSDQTQEAPGYVISSMVKRVDVAVETMIQECVENKMKAGLRSFGLTENGVALADGPDNQKLIPAPVWARLKQLRQELMAGSRRWEDAP
ncbi:MAG: BMP family lipoprotein [Candidatus Sericytochromatia bacterium]